MGLLPYKKFTFYRTIKFWLRSVLDKPPLLFEAYTMLTRLRQVNWTRKVRQGLELLGMGNVWNNQGVEDMDIFLRLLLLRIRDSHTQDFDRVARTSSRLSVLYSLQCNPCMISFHLRINLNHFLAKELTKYRLSGHRLEIEAGRWQKPTSKPIDQRICQKCELNTVENEHHFILICPEYENLRRIYLPNDILRNRTHENLVSLFSSINYATLATVLFVM